MKISVALTTYNGAFFLKDQLDSIYNQTIKPFEVLVCDDCSNDSTLQILEEYRKKNGLKYFVNERNLGYIKNFEKCIALCSGDFIALCDQDDIWLENKLEILSSYSQNYSIVCSDAFLINEKGEIIHRSYAGFSDLSVPNRLKIDPLIYYVFHPYVTGCTAIIAKNIFLKAIPFPENVPHDFWMALHAINDKGISFLDVSLVKYRQHNSNSIGALKSSRFINFRRFRDNERKKIRINGLTKTYYLLNDILNNYPLTNDQYKIIKTKLIFLDYQIKGYFSFSIFMRNFFYDFKIRKRFFSAVKISLFYLSDTLFKIN